MKRFILFYYGSFITIIKFVIDENKELTVCNYLKTKKCSVSQSHFLVKKEFPETKSINTEDIFRICTYILKLKENITYVQHQTYNTINKNLSKYT